MTLIFYIIIYLFVFGAMEIVRRKNILTSENTRRIIHLLSALIAFTFPYLLSRNEIIILSGIFFVLLILSKSKKILGSIHLVDRKTYGEIFFPIGIAISAFSLLPNNSQVFQMSMLILGIADLSANIIGSNINSKRLTFWNTSKTIAGTLTCFFVALIILCAYKFSLPRSILIAGLIAIIELLSPRGSDNLTIPAIIILLTL